MLAMVVAQIVKSRQGPSGQMNQERQDYLKYLSQKRREVRRTAHRQRDAQLFLHPSPDQLQAELDQARRPWFYRDGGVPDSPEGRFEVIGLHAFFVLRRLRALGEPGQALGQEVFDVMFADLDRSLRELGVGDLSVGKHVKRYARFFYGRVAGLEQAFAAGDIWSGRDDGADANTLGQTSFLFLLMAVLGGASFVGAEYKAGTVTTLLTWEPRRTRVMSRVVG
jgi:hypothetical protein